MGRINRVGMRRSRLSCVVWRAHRISSEGVEMAIHHLTEGLNTPDSMDWEVKTLEKKDCKSMKH